MTDTPNLYGFATKELAQDATIAYIVAWADPQYKDSHPRLHALGTELLRSLLATDSNLMQLPCFGYVNVQTQVDRIDLLVRINANHSKNRIILIIEDKVSTQEHSNQIERYICTAKTNYAGKYDHMSAVYLKTGNESQGSLPPADKCGRFLRRNLLEVLDGFTDTKNVIVDDFRTHLQRWEDETNAWESTPYDSWQWRAWEGFYATLEESWREKHADWCGWGYVPNPSGGFLGWWGGLVWIGTDDRHMDLFIQIHNGTRLTVRLGSGNLGEKVRSQKMHTVFNRLQESCEETSHVFQFCKAGRFRGGWGAAVADVKICNEDPWFMVDTNGIVDMHGTVERLCELRDLLRKVAGELTGAGLFQD